MGKDLLQDHDVVLFPDAQEFVFSLDKEIAVLPSTALHFAAPSQDVVSRSMGGEDAALPSAPTAASLDQPQSGSLGTSALVTASGDQRIDGILSGVRWNATTLVYSDPDRASDYQFGYLSDDDGDGISAQNEGFSQLNLFELNAAVSALEADLSGVESFTNLTLTWSRGAASAHIRIANSSDPTSSYGYYPGNGVYSGDVWIGPSANRPTPGNYDWNTMFHELGHALGLRHGHLAGGPANTALPYDTDSMEYSVMTYRGYVGQPDPEVATNEEWGYAQTFMMYDIAALQYMYGANFTENSGDTTYTWSPAGGQTYIDGSFALNPGANRIFETIWDGGGVDTYDLSNYTTNLQIDLSPGGYSLFSTAQRAYLGGGPNGGYARGNVFNALQYQGDPRSLIENAYGGSGNDTFVGNVADNGFRGGAGNDTMTGGGGNDSLDGGAGIDTAVYAGASSSYVVVQTATGYTVTGEGTDTLTNMENVAFANGTFSLATIDDFGASTAAAGSASVGGSVAGVIEHFGDHDWFRVTLNAGEHYEVEASGGTLGGPQVQLYGSTGSLLRSGGSSLVYTPTVTGTYYVDASGASSSATGSYTLRVAVAGQFGPTIGDLANFGVNAGGWSSDRTFPRQLADVNGDGRADIVGFGNDGVLVSLATASGSFSAPSYGLYGSYGASGSAGGWFNQTLYPRLLGDVNGDGRADIVAFGQAGVQVSLATGNGAFAAPIYPVANFGASDSAGGWTSQDRYTRLLGDVNGDGMDDIVGFGVAGAYVALATGGGNFGPVNRVVDNFGTSDAAGGWTSQDRYTRALGDVNGDGMDDILGFGVAGVYAALSTGGGRFAAAQFVVSNFGQTAGWTSDNVYHREVADVDGNGRADIVGFGQSGVYVSLATAGGSFGQPALEVGNFGPGAGGWTSQDLFPRHLADINGDHAADIVGFGANGIFKALSLYHLDWA